MAKSDVQNIDKILKRDDIRGVYPTDLNEAVAYYLGRAMVKVLFPVDKPKVAIGWDQRVSSPTLSHALAQGLAEAGAEVLILGQCGSELVYFSAGSVEGISGGVMITASHNPKDQNGFKIVKTGAQPASPDELKQIAAELVSMASETDEPFEAAVCQRLEVSAGFAEKVVSVSGIRRESKQCLKLLVESGHGMGGETFEKVANLLPYLDIIYSHKQPDGDSGRAFPNPVKAEYMKEVSEGVLANKADLGLGFDGDGDRVGISDSKGSPMGPSELIAIMAERFLSKGDSDRRKIMYNLVCSRLVKDRVEALGGTAVMTPVGHGQIKGLMRLPKHEDCVFAGEHSGHYFFRDFYLADSGVTASLGIIETTMELKDEGKDLGDKLADWRKKYFSKLEINFLTSGGGDERATMQGWVDGVRKFGEERSGKAVAEYEPGLPIEPLNNVDILKMEFEEDFGSWWFCLRPSGNEALLRLVAEVVLNDESIGKVDGEKLLDERHAALIDCIGKEHLEK